MPQGGRAISRRPGGTLVTSWRARWPCPPPARRPTMESRSRKGTLVGRSDRDDVLVRRALGLLAGRPGLGRHAAVLGPADLGRLRPDHQRYPKAAAPRRR